MVVLSLPMSHPRLLDPMLRVLGLVGCLFACGCQSTSTPVPASGNADSGDRADSTSSVDSPGADGAEAEGSIAEAGLFDSEADTSSHDGGMMQGTTCSMPYDCVGAKVSSACCFDNTCVPVSLPDCSDAGAQPILAMSYDQSCAMDSDCIAIAEGNGACAGAFSCAHTNAAINKGDYARYKSDIAKTRAASCFVLTSCLLFLPCCRAGTCHADLACPIGSAPDAATNAGSD